MTGAYVSLNLGPHGFRVVFQVGARDGKRVGNSVLATGLAV